MPSVATVTGPITPEELGITHVHEHLILDMRFYHDILCKYPLPEAQAKLAEAKLSIENLGVSRRNQFLIKDALVMDDEELVIPEVSQFKAYGGSSLVEVTLPGLGRDVVALRRIAEATGVNIIAATGWYVALSHPPYVKEKSVDELAEIMVTELTEGIEGTGIRAGVIKAAVGGVTDDPNAPLADYVFHPDEEKVLQAGARAQKATGAPMTMHPCIFRRDGQAYIDVLEDEGANLEKFWMSHLSGTFPEVDVEYCKSLMDRGISISFDNFGYEKYSQLSGGTCITDKERVKALAELCEQGYDTRIMLAHDNCQKDRLKQYGGYGYSHILEHIVLDLKARGVSDVQIHNMLVENPKRMLAD